MEQGESPCESVTVMPPYIIRRISQIHGSLVFCRNRKHYDLTGPPQMGRVRSCFQQERFFVFYRGGTGYGEF